MLFEFSFNQRVAYWCVRFIIAICYISCIIVNRTNTKHHWSWGNDKERFLFQLILFEVVGYGKKLYRYYGMKPFSSLHENDKYRMQCWLQRPLTPKILKRLELTHENTFIIKFIAWGISYLIPIGSDFSIEIRYKPKRQKCKSFLQRGFTLSMCRFSHFE